jgi:exonuclease V gamma subunit
MSEDRKQFMRIAMARLTKSHPFKAERLAVAANMYRRWLDRQIAR